MKGLPQLPDGQFQPAMPLNCAEEKVAGRLAKLFEGRRRIIPARMRQPHARAARPRTLPVPQRLLRSAVRTGAYFSTQSSTLPAAVATGNLTLKTFAIVTEVVYDKDSKRATGVRVIDAVTEADDGVSAKRRVPVRLRAELDLAADAIGDRRMARRAGQQLGRAGPQPDGPPFPLGADGSVGDGIEDKTVYGRRPSGLLHSALPEPVRRQARIPARLRLPGRRQPRRDGSARSRSSASARAFKDQMATPGAVADRAAPRSARCCRTTRTR